MASTSWINPKPCGPVNTPVRQEPDDGRNPQTMTDVEHDYGKTEDDEDVLKKDELHVHPSKKEDSY